MYLISSASVRRSKPVQHKIYLWNKADLDTMKGECCSITTKFLADFTTSSAVEEIWSAIKTSILGLQEKHVPSKMSSRRFSQPWVNRNVKRATRRKKRSFWKARKTNNTKDYERYHRLKKESRTACKSAYNSYIKNIISPDSTSNPKRFWGFIKGMRTDATGVAPLKNSTGLTHWDSSRKANILNEQFSSVFNKDESTDTIPDKGPSPYLDMPHITVGREGVRKLLSNLQIHKATGPDGVACRLLKELAFEIAPMFQVLFRASLNQASISAEWKTANVVPIYKKGEKNKAENYRPVSLTSVTCKMPEHILCSNIMTHLESNNILHDAQHGFRKRRSCESQLIVTIQDLAHNIDSKVKTDVILLDFSKAFDKVPHKRLLYKLHHYGIRNSNIGWIQDFLVGRTQQVLLEGGVRHPQSQSSLESPREVYSGRCFSSYSLMTFWIVSRRVQRFAYARD